MTSTNEFLLASHFTSSRQLCMAESLSTMMIFVLVPVQLKENL